MPDEQWHDYYNGHQLGDGTQRKKEQSLSKEKLAVGCVRATPFYKWPRVSNESLRKKYSFFFRGIHMFDGPDERKKICFYLNVVDGWDLNLTDFTKRFRRIMLNFKYSCVVSRPYL